MERRDTKTQSSCHAGFAIRRNPLFGFVIRIIYVGVADYKSARGVYGGLQIRRDKKSAVTKNKREKEIFILIYVKWVRLSVKRIHGYGRERLSLYPEKSN